MSIRTKFFLAFIGLCVVFTLVQSETYGRLSNSTTLRWAILAEWVGFFVAGWLLLRYFRRHFPPPSKTWTSMAVRNARRMAWIYFAASSFVLLAEGRNIVSFPYGLGFVIPVVPILLGVHSLRTAKRLARISADTE